MKEIVLALDTSADADPDEGPSSNTNITNDQSDDDGEPERPVRKQVFKNLSEILDVSNFDDLPPHTSKDYVYQTKAMLKKNEEIRWKTVQDSSNQSIDGSSKVPGPSNVRVQSRETPSRIPVLVRRHTPANDIEIEGGPVRRRQPPGKRCAENISKTTPVRSVLAKNISNELDSWTVFFTDEILGLIVMYTNASILRYISDNSDKINKEKDIHVRALDMMELKAIIGLMYLRGAMHRNLSDIMDVFTHESAPDIFQATMSYRHYRFIKQFLSFDHSVTRPDCCQNDKFACYRVVFEALNKQNAIMRVPSLHMTIDEALFPYRGRISIKNYNPNKSARSGLLLISISDAEVGRLNSITVIVSHCDTIQG